MDAILIDTFLVIIFFSIKKTERDFFLRAFAWLALPLVPLFLLIPDMDPLKKMWAGTLLAFLLSALLLHVCHFRQSLGKYFRRSVKKK